MSNKVLPGDDVQALEVKSSAWQSARRRVTRQWPSLNPEALPSSSSHLSVEISAMQIGFASSFVSGKAYRRISRVQTEEGTDEVKRSWRSAGLTIQKRLRNTQGQSVSVKIVKTLPLCFPKWSILTQGMKKGMGWKRGL